MKVEDVEKIFKFTPNTEAQDKAIAKVYECAGILAAAITKCVPPQHGDQALMQLAGLVTLCRQGIEVEKVESRPVLVTH